MEKKIPPGYWLVGAIVLLILVFVVIVPAYKGWRVYHALSAAGVSPEYITDMQGLSAKNEQLLDQLHRTEAARDEASTQETQAHRDAQAAQEALATCQAENEKQKKLCNDLADSLANEKASAEASVQEMQDALAAAAQKICCMERVVKDSDISGYRLEDNTITCVTSGGEPIAC